MGHLVFCCEDARRAYRDRVLVWEAVVRGWTLTDIPLRKMTHQAQYHASERGNYADHSGEPYRFDLCPFCAGDLPYGHALLTGGDDGTTPQD